MPSDGHSPMRSGGPDGQRDRAAGGLLAELVQRARHVGAPRPDLALDPGGRGHGGRALEGGEQGPAGVALVDEARLGGRGGRRGGRGRERLAGLLAPDLVQAHRHLFQGDRLREEVAGAEVHRAHGHVHRAVRGEHDGVDRRPQRAGGGQHLHAVDRLHLEVGEDDVGRVAPDVLDRRSTVVLGRDDVAALPEQAGQRVGGGPVVVHDQDPEGGGPPTARSP